MKISTCQASRCGSSPVSRGYCNRHYLQVLRHGSVRATQYDKRPAVIDGDVAYIPLGVGARQGYAMVDLDCSWVDQYLWSKHHSGYAHALINGEQVAMHRLLTNKPVGMHVDHKNHDRTDNRMQNLRVCSRTENRRNSTKARNNTTGFKGVVVSYGRYSARIGYLGKKLHLGYYDTPEEAAMAYDKKAIELHGDFALTNFKDFTT